MSARWRILISFLFISGCQSAPVVVEGPRIPLRGLHILQGYTSPTATQFAVLTPKGVRLSYAVHRAQGDSELVLRNITVQKLHRHDSDWAVERVLVDGLKPGFSYGLEVRDALGRLVDSREFFALDFKKNSTRFAAVNGLEPSRGSQSIWSALLEQKPDFILFTGNAVHAVESEAQIGGATPARLWASHVEARLRLELARAPTLVPTLAVWSEGEYGSTGTRDFSYRREAADAFRAFFSQEPDRIYLNVGPGTSRFLEAFGMNFALMDGRYFRTGPQAKADGETYWGKAQENWLQILLEERLAPTWLINGEPIFGSTTAAYETREAKSFQKVSAQLSQSAQPLAFLSGYAAATHAGSVNSPRRWKSFEVLSVPGSYVFIHAQALSRRTLAAQVAIHAADGTKLVQRELKLDAQGKKSKN